MSERLVDIFYHKRQIDSETDIIKRYFVKSNPSNPGFVLYLRFDSYYSNSVRWQDFAVTINFIGGHRIPEAAESYNDPIQINFYRLSLCWQYQYKSILEISKKPQS